MRRERLNIGNKIKHLAIWSLLNQAGHLDQDYNLWATWSRCIASAIYLENMFWDDVQACNKSVYTNLEGREKWVYGVKADVLEWCSMTYDPHHKLRFAVETLDSIESVRLYLENKSKEVGYHVSLHNLLRMTTPTFTFAEVN